MLTMEKQQRLEAAAQVLFARKEPVKFELDMVLTVGLIGHLQLAFRHPANTGPTSEILKKFTIDLIEKLDPGKGDIYDFLMHGFNPNYDTVFYKIMKEKYDTKIKLTIPNVGYIEIAGNPEFVSKMFNYIKIEFYGRLQTALRTFKGSYEGIEKSGKNKTEIQIVEKD